MRKPDDGALPAGVLPHDSAVEALAPLHQPLKRFVVLLLAERRLVEVKELFERGRPPVKVGGGQFGDFELGCGRHGSRLAKDSVGLGWVDMGQDETWLL